MNNELKEMMNNIENMSEEERKKQLEWSDTHEFGTAYAYYLLDYITNLQEEINKLIVESTEWESKCYQLQEENSRLKQEISNLKFILSGHWEEYEKGDDTND